MPLDFNFKRDFIGDYDYKWLCMPRLPWTKAEKDTPMYGRNEPIPILLGIIMGFQHALAMSASLVTVPFVIAKFNMDQFPYANVDLHNYVISSALIVSSIFTLVNVVQLNMKLGPLKLTIGTGLISVLGISFTFLPIYESSISLFLKPECLADFGYVRGSASSYDMSTQTRQFSDLKDYFSDRSCTAQVADFPKDYFFICDPDCDAAAYGTTPRIAHLQKCAAELCGDEAYGKMLGTCALICFLEVFLALLPLRILKKVFPQIVCSVVVTLIGIGLVAASSKYFGGGVVCAESQWRDHPEIAGSTPFGAGVTYGATQQNFAVSGFLADCGNGEVKLGFGSAEYIGLGFSVFSILWVVELFGSPFMKNTNVIIGILFGFLVAGLAGVEIPNPNNDDPATVYGSRLRYGYTRDASGVWKSPLQDCDDNGQNCQDRWTAGYWTDSNMASAPFFNFVFAKVFPLGVYWPAVPLCIVATMVTTAETVGDVRATYDVSGLDADGADSEEFAKSMQGGLVVDGLGSSLGALLTVPPNTTYSENNGIIAMTKCASRRAGLWVALWLFVFGVFGKVGSLFASVPYGVEGGVLTFLFSQVLVSGIAMVPQPISRRDRFVWGTAVGIGATVAFQPGLFLDGRGAPFSAHVWPCESDETKSYVDTVTNQTVTFDNPMFCSETAKFWRATVLIFFGTPYAIGLVVAWILQFTIPNEPEEGLKKEDEKSEKDSEKDTDI